MAAAGLDGQSLAGSFAWSKTSRGPFGIPVLAARWSAPAKHDCIVLLSFIFSKCKKGNKLVLTPKHNLPYEIQFLE